MVAVVILNQDSLVHTCANDVRLEKAVCLLQHNALLWSGKRLPFQTMLHVNEDIGQSAVRGNDVMPALERFAPGNGAYGFNDVFIRRFADQDDLSKNFYGCICSLGN